MSVKALGRALFVRPDDQEGLAAIGEPMPHEFLRPRPSLLRAGVSRGQAPMDCQELR